MKRKWLKPALMAFMICLSLALVGVGGFLFAGCTKNKGVQGDAAVSYKWKVTSDTVKAITFNFTTNSGTSASYVQNTWLNEWMQDTVSKTSNFTLYRHTFGTMYQSTNGGSSWMSSGTDEVIYSTQSTAYTANTVYAGAAPPYISNIIASRSGYVFNGFWTSSSGGTQLINSTASFTTSASTTTYSTWYAQFNVESVYTITLSTQSVNSATAPSSLYYSTSSSRTGTYSSETQVSSPNGKTFTITQGYTLRFRTYHGSAYETAFVAAYKTGSSSSTASAASITTNHLLHPGLTTNNSQYSDYMYITPNTNTTLVIYSNKRMNRIALNTPSGSGSYGAYTGYSTSGVVFTSIDLNFNGTTSAPNWVMPQRGSYWDGWFSSANHTNSSAKTMKLTFTVPTTMNLTFQYFQQSEASYDYAYFSKLDTPFQYPGGNSAESSSYYEAAIANSSGTYSTVTYSSVSQGTHTIYVKYKKDGSGHRGADGICFRPLFNYVFGGTYSFFFYPQDSTDGQGQTNFRVGYMTKSGYTFNGWYDAASGGNQQAVSSGSDIAVTTSNGRTYPLVVWYPQFTANTITITLDKQSGSGGTTNVYYKYGTNTYYSNSACTSTITSITAPTRTGYTFGGYYSSTGGSGTQYITSSSSFANSLYNAYTSNNTIYAKWTANQYNVAFASNGATTFTTSGMTNNMFTATFGTVYRISNYVTAIAKTGYTFSGWTISYYNSSTAKVGTTSSPTTSYTDQVISNSYYFKDLYTEITSPSTFMAQWTANTYTVTASASGGSFSSVSGWTASGSNYTKSVTYNSQYGTLPTVTRSRYTFDGWHVATASGTTITSSTTVSTASDHTIVPKWNATSISVTIKPYYFTYIGTGTNALPTGATLSVSYTKVTSGATSSQSNISQTNASTTYNAWQGSSFSVSATPPSGYVFAGLHKTNVSATSSGNSFTVPTGSVTYYAVFQEAKTNIYFNDNDHSHYFYDGEYPQSYVGDYLNNTLNNTTLSSSARGFNMGDEDLSVYVYQSNEYVKSQAQWTISLLLGGGQHVDSAADTYSFTAGSWYWFKVEPIKWRITSWGEDRAMTEGQAFTNVYGISDILGYGQLGSVDEGDPGKSAYEAYPHLMLEQDSSMEYVGGTPNDSDEVVVLDSDIDTYNTVGHTTKVTTSAYDWMQYYPGGNDYYFLITASLKDINRVTHDLTTYASDYSAFKMGFDYDRAYGWTRNLYNLDSVYAIGPGGIRTPMWVDVQNGYIFAHKTYQAVYTGWGA